MFPDQQDAIHGQVAAAAGQGFRDRRIELHPRMPLRRSREEVILADLLDVERDHVHRRAMIGTLPAVTLKKSINDVFRNASICKRRWSVPRSAVDVERPSHCGPASTWTLSLRETTDVNTSFRATLIEPGSDANPTCLAPAVQHASVSSGNGTGTAVAGTRELGASSSAVALTDRRIRSKSPAPQQ